MAMLPKYLNQFARFGLVGVLNTCVDFAVTNLLFLLFRPLGAVGLAAISIVAGIVATTNSYYVNSKWTFSDREGEPFALPRFALVALAGLTVNTAVFLFATKYLPMLVSLGPISNLNVARLIAVGAALSVTFLGYSLGVFRSRGIVAFRFTNVFESAQSAPAWRPMLWILLLGLLLRLCFLALAPVVYGDAVNYSWVAFQIGMGEFSQVDTFWHSLFDYWQALFVLAGADRHAAMVLSTLVPGALMPIPVYLLGRRLHGESTGLLAALITSMHPRLIEYSVNGYGEMYYLFAAMWAVWGLTALHQDPRNMRPALVAGVGLGAYFLTRNETILLIAVWFAASVIASKKDRFVPMAKGLLIAVAVAASLTLAYVLVNQALWDHHGLFAKNSNLTKFHVENLDLAAAARETYGSNATRAVDPLQVLPTLMARWPRNVLYTLERLPGVLLSPLVLFALLLPVLATRREMRRGDAWPLLVFTFWPLLFYPWIQLEPRLLFATLMGVNLFGAAGVIAFGRFLSDKFQPRGHSTAWTAAAPGALVVALLLPICPLLAWHSKSIRGYHREVGEWITQHLRSDVRLTGDGYGYINATAFWAGRTSTPRRWTDSPNDLAQWVRAEQFGIVILYEEYIRNANPELMNVFQTNLPGLTLLKEFDFPKVGHVRIFGESDLAVSCNQPAK